MLTPLPFVNSPKWLISPDCQQKMGGGAAAPLRTPSPFAYRLCMGVTQF